MLERTLAPSISCNVADLRGASAVMLAGGALLPFFHGHVGLPCPLRTLTGIPCPLCGMTTSVEGTVHLQLGDAVRANPAGPAVVLAAIALLTLRPRRPLHVPALAFAVIALALWLFELHRFAVL